MESEQSSDQLDALIAAPSHHKLLFENELVRVLEACIAPGDTTPLHTHCWPGTLYFLSWSDFVRRDANGDIVLDSRTIPSVLPGTALWSPALAAHTLENTGNAELRVIAVELKINSANDQL